MKLGRPTDFRPEFHEDFINLSKQGKSIVQICAKWGISRECFYNWKKTVEGFSDTVDQGRALAEAWYADLGQAGLLGQAKVNGKPVELRTNIYKWLTTNMFGWSQKIETKNEHTGKNGGPVKYSDLSKDQLKEEIKKELELLEGKKE